jgi:hypothetical protein
MPFHGYKIRDPHGVQSECAAFPISVRCDDSKLLSHPATGIMSGTISYGEGLRSLERLQDNHRHCERSRASIFEKVKSGGVD